jgi:transcriptional regulator with XRE-family HTH domain
MTQTELGIKLAEFQPDGQPIPQTTISRWERGTVDMTFDQALEIEMALGCPLGTLARAGGYISADEQHQNVEDALRVDPLLDPEIREDAIRAYKSYVNVSRRVNREEMFETPKRRRSTSSR